MKWLWWNATRAEIIGALFVVVLLCVVAVASIFGPQQRTNAGFGPDWDCKTVPTGGPICIKKPGHSPSESDPNRSQ
jgi:hypothetical protein